MVLQQCTPGTHPSDLLQLPGLANGARCLLRDYHAINSLSALSTPWDRAAHYPVILSFYEWFAMLIELVANERIAVAVGYLQTKGTASAPLVGKQVETACTHQHRVTVL